MANTDKDQPLHLPFPAGSPQASHFLHTVETVNPTAVPIFRPAKAAPHFSPSPSSASLTRPKSDPSAAAWTQRPVANRSSLFYRPQIQLHFQPKSPTKPDPLHSAFDSSGRHQPKIRPNTAAHVDPDLSAFFPRNSSPSQQIERKKEDRKHI